MTPFDNPEPLYEESVLTKILAQLITDAANGKWRKGTSGLMSSVFFQKQTTKAHTIGIELTTNPKFYFSLTLTSTSFDCWGEFFNCCLCEYSFNDQSQIRFLDPIGEHINQISANEPFVKKLTFDNGKLSFYVDFQKAQEIYYRMLDLLKPIIAEE